MSIKPKIITFNLYKKSGSTAKILTSENFFTQEDYSATNEYQLFDQTNKENTNKENQIKHNNFSQPHQSNSTKHATNNHNKLFTNNNNNDTEKLMMSKSAENFFQLLNNKNLGSNIYVKNEKQLKDLKVNQNLASEINQQSNKNTKKHVKSQSPTKVKFQNLISQNNITKNNNGERKPENIKTNSQNFIQKNISLINQHQDRHSSKLQDFKKSHNNNNLQNNNAISNTKLNQHKSQEINATIPKQRPNVNKSKNNQKNVGILSNNNLHTQPLKKSLQTKNNNLHLRNTSTPQQQFKKIEFHHKQNNNFNKEQPKELKESNVLTPKNDNNNIPHHVRNKSTPSSVDYNKSKTVELEDGGGLCCNHSHSSSQDSEINIKYRPLRQSFFSQYKNRTNESIDSNKEKQKQQSQQQIKEAEAQMNSKKKTEKRDNLNKILNKRSTSLTRNQKSTIDTISNFNQIPSQTKMPKQEIKEKNNQYQQYQQQKQQNKVYHIQQKVKNYSMQDKLQMIQSCVSENINIYSDYDMEMEDSQQIQQQQEDHIHVIKNKNQNPQESENYLEYSGSSSHKKFPPATQFFNDISQLQQDMQKSQQQQHTLSSSQSKNIVSILKNKNYQQYNFDLNQQQQEFLANNFNQHQGHVSNIEEFRFINVYNRINRNNKQFDVDQQQQQNQISNSNNNIIERIDSFGNKIMKGSKRHSIAFKIEDEC